MLSERKRKPQTKVSAYQYLHNYNSNNKVVNIESFSMMVNSAKLSPTLHIPLNKQLVSNYIWGLNLYASVRMHPIHHNA